MKDSPVVTCFLRNRGEVLLLRRSGKVGSYRGRWGAVAGYVEEDPERSAWREIQEETGLDRGVELVRAGEPFVVEDEALGRRWVVHPFLFDGVSRDVRLDWESVEAEWVPPPEIRRRETVPDLWTSYAQVAPSLETIQKDRAHGSSYLSLRALEVLRDAASAPEARWDELAELGLALIAARPSMVALANRIHRAMHAAQGNVRRLETEAHRGIVRALESDEAAATQAADLISGQRVMTLSRSETVTSAIRRGKPSAVVVTESRPGGEGVVVADSWREAGLDVTVVPDAAMAAVLGRGDVDLVLVGADAVLPSGSFVNKVGTRLLALAAGREDVPFYVSAAEDKTSPDDDVVLEPSDVAGVPLFETTEAELVNAFVTENGPCSPERMAQVAERLRSQREW